MAIVTMTQALKKLYKAVVGEDTTKNNPTKIVSDLADNYSGGGSSLPDVTASDNGKVLTVVEGEWDKAAGGGGAEPLIVKFVKSGTSPDVIRLDHTCGEIRQAVLNGRSVIRESDEAGIQVTTLSRVAWEVYEGGASFTIEEGAFGYGASLSEPPYTLEALDAEYPYTTD